MSELYYMRSQVGYMRCGIFPYDFFARRGYFAEGMEEGQEQPEICVNIALKHEENSTQARHNE
jgi:hypothetical protein